jgi:tetratricopeptide (TPR) repeat protein
VADEIDDGLIDLFDQGAEAGREGDHERSLELYREVIARATAGTDPAPSTAEFLATARMRAAFCLMDLERYEEARAELEQARLLEAALDSEGRFELYRALGNTFGQLGRLDECFAALIEAVSAAEDLDDYTERPAACWSWILAHAERLEAWAFLRQKAEIALNTARLRGMDDLADTATEMIALADRNLA